MNGDVFDTKVVESIGVNFLMKLRFSILLCQKHHRSSSDVSGHPAQLWHKKSGEYRRSHYRWNLTFLNTFVSNSFCRGFWCVRSSCTTLTQKVWRIPEITIFDRIKKLKKAWLFGANQIKKYGFQWNVRNFCAKNFTVHLNLIMVHDSLSVWKMTDKSTFSWNLVSQYFCVKNITVHLVMCPVILHNFDTKSPESIGVNFLMKLRFSVLLCQKHHSSSSDVSGHPAQLWHKKSGEYRRKFCGEIWLFSILLCQKHHRSSSDVSGHPAQLWHKKSGEYRS